MYARFQTCVQKNTIKASKLCIFKKNLWLSNIFKKIPNQLLPFIKNSKKSGSFTLSKKCTE